METQRNNLVQEKCGNESDISSTLMIIDVRKYPITRAPHFPFIKNEEDNNK